MLDLFWLSDLNKHEIILLEDNTALMNVSHLSTYMLYLVYLSFLFKTTVIIGQENYVLNSANSSISSISGRK